MFALTFILLNALFPSFLSVSFVVLIVTVFSAVQPLKAFAPTEVTFELSVIFVIALQFANALLPMVVSLVDNVNDLSFLHSANADAPIDSTFLPPETVVSAVHL